MYVSVWLKKNDNCDKFTEKSLYPWNKQKIDFSHAINFVLYLFHLFQTKQEL